MTVEDEQSQNLGWAYEQWQGRIEMDVDGTPDTFQEYLLKYYPSLAEQEETISVQTG